MFSFSSPQPHPLTLTGLIASTASQPWNYLNALRLAKSDLQQISYSQIMENPGDVAMGVSAVEVIFNRIFFGVFDGLVIKHRSSGEILMMFYTDNASAEQVQSIFHLLKGQLGPGTLMDHKFSSFSAENITKLASGQTNNDGDEIAHTWLLKAFSFMLNYQLDPAKRLLLNFSWKPAQLKDSLIRAKGTLIPLMHHSLSDLLNHQHTTEKITTDENGIKFIDYTYTLEPAEFGIFEKLDIRIFDQQKKLNQSVQCHLNYYSDFEVNTPAAIVLTDRLVEIYGKDDLGSAELEAYELDDLDNSDYFRGRTWTVNTGHGLCDLSDPEQHILYQIRLSSDPGGQGFALHIMAFNKMLDYQELFF